MAVQQSLKSLKNQTKDSEDDEEIVDESSSDSEIEADYMDVEQSARISRKRRSRKKTRQKNIIKQRLVKLLKKFKEPEDNVRKSSSNDP